LSTFSCRCAVARMYSLALRPRFSMSLERSSAILLFSFTASTTVLPVTATPLSIPSLARFFLASSVGAKSMSEMWSATTRFTSSGMVRS